MSLKEGNLKLWLSAEEAAVVTDDAGNVSSWVDWSGNKKHAIPVSSEKAPTFIENSFNAGGGFFGTFDNQQDAENQIESVLKENKELKAENVEVWRHHEHLLYLADSDMNLSATPVLWDLKSSAIKPSKAWNTQIHSQAGHRFSYIWKVKNATASNGSNTWFTFATELARGETGNPLYTPEGLVKNIQEMLDSDGFSF